MLCRQSTSPFSRGGKDIVQGEGMVRFLEGLVRGEGWCGNSSGSRPNFFGRQHLTFDKGGKGVGDFRGIIVFLQLLWEWQYSVQREEQARQGCLSVCAQVLCKDAKPTKHTQTLILRKVGGIVQMQNWQSVHLKARVFVVFEG